MDIPKPRAIEHVTNLRENTELIREEALELPRPLTYGTVVGVGRGGEFGFVDVLQPDGTKSTVFIHSQDRANMCADSYLAEPHTFLDSYSDKRPIERGERVAMYRIEERRSTKRSGQQARASYWTSEENGIEVDAVLEARARRYPVGIYFYPEREATGNEYPQARRLEPDGEYGRWHRHASMYDSSPYENIWFWVNTPGEFPHGVSGWRYGPTQRSFHPITPSLHERFGDGISPEALQYVEGQDEAQAFLRSEYERLKQIPGHAPVELLPLIHAGRATDYGSRYLVEYDATSRAKSLVEPASQSAEAMSHDAWREYLIELIASDNRKYDVLNNQIVSLQQRTTIEIPVVSLDDVKAILDNSLPHEKLTVAVAKSFLPDLTLSDVIPDELHEEILRQSPDDWQGYKLNYGAGAPYVELRAKDVDSYPDESRLADGREILVSVDGGALSSIATLRNSIKEAAVHRHKKMIYDAAEGLVRGREEQWMIDSYLDPKDREQFLVYVEHLRDKVVTVAAQDTVGARAEEPSTPSDVEDATLTEEAGPVSLEQLSALQRHFQS